MIERELIIVVRLRMIEMTSQRADFQRRSIHRYDHVGLVARGEYVLSQFHLETTHASQRTLRGTYLGGEVGQGRNLMAKNGTQRGKKRTRQLHSVAGVATKSHNNILHDIVYFINLLQNYNFFLICAKKSVSLYPILY